MSSGPLRHLIAAPRLLLAVIALVSQLALGSVVLPDDVPAQSQSVAALDALSILCGTETPGSSDQAPAHRQAPDHALCPLSVALAMPGVILASGIDLPPPSARQADRAVLPPPARGPPAQRRDTPPPRGPPVQA